MALVLKGVQAASVEDSKHAQGRFGLQFGNGPKDSL